MTRSLPENTVDAWTAIELARNDARWIWLPTTNQGATFGGSHPGDVSSMLGRRLVLIENKAIEGETRIDFGSKGAAQRHFLRFVEDAGLAAVCNSTEFPPLGWVFYGLPIKVGPVYGSDWGCFPSWHHLVCPHTLDAWGLGPTVDLDDLSCLSASTSAARHRGRVHCIPRAPHLEFTLEWLRLATRVGWAGLPLADTESALFSQLHELVTEARTAAVESRDLADVQEVDIAFFNGDTILELLQELAAIAAAWSGRTTLSVS